MAIDRARMRVLCWCYPYTQNKSGVVQQLLKLKKKKLTEKSINLILFHVCFTIMNFNEPLFSIRQFVVVKNSGYPKNSRNHDGMKRQKVVLCIKLYLNLNKGKSEVSFVYSWSDKLGFIRQICLAG